MDINQKIFDQIVDHMGDVRLFEESVQIGNRRIIRRHRERLRDLLRRDLKERTRSNEPLRREQSRFATELFSWQKTNLMELSTAEIDFISDAIYKQTRDFYRTRKPSTRELLAEITGPGMVGEKSLKGNIRNISSGELIRIQTKVKAGLAAGAKPDQIIQEVMKTTKITQHQAATLTRTSITSTQREAVMSVMENNDSLIKGYMFSAILDSRTSGICRYHNGKMYPISEKRYRPPLHFNCRSTMVPVLKSKSELAASKSTRINKDALAKKQPQSLSGKAPPKESFGEWLKRQVLDVQVKMLGSETKANLFREGKLKAEQFINAAGDALSIIALRRRAALVTEVFTPRQKMRSVDVDIRVSRPSTLVNNPKFRTEVRNLYVLDSDDWNKTFALTDFKGTTLQGKQTARRRVGNQFDESNHSFDPLTGEAKNNNLYDPNFQLYQERLDFMRNSKILRPEHKGFIQSVSDSLEDKVSVNQQTVVVENLRVVLERAIKDGKPWEDFASVLRAENRFAVQNVSRLLDTRQRKRNNLFARFFGSKDQPEIQIMGKYYTLDQLNADILKDQREIDSFRRKYGTKLAADLYLKGKAPARAYFHGLAGKFPTKKKIKKRLLEMVPFKKEYDAYVKKRGEPKDEWWIRQAAKFNEAYRNIIDAEWATLSKKPSTALLDDKVINSLSKSVKLVASGQMTDYDGLAIAIGKQMAKDFEDILPFTKHTLQSYHKEGSRILDYMVKRRLIRTNFRGKTRRGVYDVDTGRASGSWGDTVSREVEILDKDMLKLQEAERRVTIARRLGVVNPRDRLYVRANKKTYVDSRGNDTGIPIISRSKAASYDPKQIDHEMANMMNHAMNVEYEVDNQFVDFMDSVVRFRDPRGNAKYYDSINEFRHDILKRGDAGYGLMTTAKWHAQRGKPFKTYVYIDSRGRVYHRGYLTPTGGEMVRPFLNDSKATPMNFRALEELRLQTGALIGPGTEALTHQGRMEIFKRHEKQILELGEILLQTTQRDRRIREFLEHPLIRSTEGVEVPKMARLAMEYARIHRHTKGDINNDRLLKTYKTKLMVENDASASGAQIIGLSTRDRDISFASNVVPTPQKNRLYDLVAMDTIDDPEFRKIPALRDAGLTWEDLAKGAKAANMVTFYGAGAATQAANVTNKMVKVLQGKGFITVTKDELTNQLRIIDGKIKVADRIGASVTVDELRAFRSELIDMVNNQQSTGIKLLKEAEDIHPDTAEFVRKLTDRRKGLVGPKDFERVAEIMAKNLNARAPVTGKFIQFWKKVAKTYVNDSQSVDIPWVTFDGKTMMQRYRPQLQQRIDFTDPVSGRKIMNIYQAEAEDGKLLGKGSVADASIGLGVNGNHSNDAVIVRRFHLWGRKEGISTGTIHDAFFTNVAEADRAVYKLREIYADAMESNTIANTLKAMRKHGMSEKNYRALLREAKELGLINPDNPVRREEVLAPIPEGQTYYGIGP
ncbi:minor head protein-like protein [Bacteriophage DSS3_PM1]|nr:minor head protein-like protein [Bacteriophage DSS3_PM1]